MPSSETPTNPTSPAERKTALLDPQHEADESAGAPEDAAAAQSGSRPPWTGRSSSRYVDYDTHELLEKITQYEDERRWQRIREGIWISIIAHILLFSGLTWIPRYVFNQPQVVDPFDAIRKRKDLTYLDELPDALKQLQKAQPKAPVLQPKDTEIDKKTLDALKATEQARPKPLPPAPQPAPKQPAQPTQTTPPPPPTPAAALPPTPQPQAALPPSTATPQPSPQIETPRPAPVPARPNFSLGSQNPADQLRQAMRDSAHSQAGGGMSGPSLNQHPGADGGAQILSDTQGVDFGPWLQKVIRETYRTWDPLIPEEVNPPILKRGEVEIVFTVLPNGRLQPHAMMLTGRSGDVALDRAAWGAIEGADFPQLPHEFHGPYIQLKFRFQYNVR